MRLLIVVNHLELGGTERHLLDLLPALVKQGIEVRIATLRPGGALAPAFAAAGLPNASQPALPAPLRIGWGLLRVLALSWTWRPDAVHCFLPESYLVGGFAALLAGRRPRLMSRRSLNDYQAKHPVAARLERWLHRHMDVLLGNARAVKLQLVAEGAPPTRTGVLYNGVALPEPVQTRPDLRRALDLPEAALVAVIVANLIPYKGHADLIEALALARRHLPEGFVLLCVGRDDGHGGCLRQLAADRGVAEHIRWLGPRMDATDFLRAADIGLLASHEEGFSNAVLEGMAAGLPMIVSDVGGNAEAVAECGLVVPPRNPAALAHALLTLAGDSQRRQALGAAARARAAATFSQQACIERYLTLYRALFAGRGGAAALKEAGLSGQ